MHLILHWHATMLIGEYNDEHVIDLPKSVFELMANLTMKW
jgi:hypothetical protein